jgi:hypothetical protein
VIWVVAGRARKMPITIDPAGGSDFSYSDDWVRTEGCAKCVPSPGHQICCVSAGALTTVVMSCRLRRLTARRGERMPLWCLWPPRSSSMVAGVGVALAPSCPGVGLAPASPTSGPDPRKMVSAALADSGRHPGPHAKIKAGGHPTPLWCVQAPEDRSAYVSEAKGMWLYAVAWPRVRG